jgi:hypothetical protein
LLEGAERHWNGTLRDELDTVLKSAHSITWRNKHPVVKLVTTIYGTGVRLTQAAMPVLETQTKRLLSLEKWFVEISLATLVSDV